MIFKQTRRRCKRDKTRLSTFTRLFPNILCPPFTVALLVHLRLFVSKLNYKLCFSFENWGRGGEGRGGEEKKIKITRFIIIAYNISENIIVQNIPFVRSFQTTYQTPFDREYFPKYVSSLVSCSVGSWIDVDRYFDFRFPNRVINLDFLNNTEIIYYFIEIYIYMDDFFFFSPSF